MSGFKEDILVDEDYLKSLLKDIQQAKKTIDLEAYIFADDAVGKEVSEALCRAAKRGVQVRVLVDGIGSITWGSKTTLQMEISGVKTRIFHPLPWKFLHWYRANHHSNIFITRIFYLLSKINYRDHRKISIIDQCIVYIGSANINDSVLPGKPEKKWHDMSVRITGVDIDEIQYAFNRAWGDTHQKPPRHHSIFHLNYSWRLRRRFYTLLLRGIANAKHRIWVMNSYFVPDSYLLKNLIKASERGIDVRILLPGVSDVAIMSFVSATFYSRLLKSNVTIYEYLPKILHAKILILDDWFSIGSSNLNHRSFLHDLEVVVEIKTDAAKNAIEKQFLFDLNQSRQIQLSDLKYQPLYKKLLGRLILLIRHWL